MQERYLYRAKRLDNVFVHDIKEEESGEYDLEDFVKWDSKNRE